MTNYLTAITRLNKLMKYIFQRLKDVGISATTSNITAMVAAGAIPVGFTVPKGTDIDTFIKTLLLTTFYPTLHAPALTVYISRGTSDVEVGTIETFILSLSFGRGSIKGAWVSGSWNVNAIQNPSVMLSIN